MTYLFIYTAQVFDDETYYLTSGLGFCTSYGDAASQLEENYGNELISITKLTLLAEGNLVMLPLDVLSKIKKEEYFDPSYLKCDADGNLL